MQAQSNMSFLSILKEPLEEFARLKPSQFAPKLRHIFSLIYIIWDNSLDYNTNERITGLFCKVPAFYCIRVIGRGVSHTGFLLLTPSVSLLIECTSTHTHRLVVLHIRSRMLQSTLHVPDCSFVDYFDVLTSTSFTQAIMSSSGNSVEQH